MRSWHRAAACLAAATLVGLGCGGDEQPTPSGGAMTAPPAARAEARANAAPVVERVILNPPEPTPGHPLEAKVQVSDPDGDAVRITFTWAVNGRVVAEGTQPVIKPDGVKKGDRIEVRVSATDGRAESQVARASTTIGNRPPQLDGVFLLPEGDVHPGDELVAQVQASDPDGDPVRSEFTWLVNGEPDRGARGPRFDTSALKRGDRVRVQAQVGDGDDRTAPMPSREVELANSAPEIERIPRISAENGAFHHQLQARDADGDRNLRFRLVEGPPGMTVDPILGTLNWRPSPDQAGTHPVEVAVEDDHGDSTSLRFEITVTATPGAPAEAPPAAPAEDDE